MAHREPQSPAPEPISPCASLGPSPPAPDPTKDPTPHFCNARDSPPPAASSSTQTHTRKYPDPYLLPPNATCTSENSPALYPYKKSQTPKAAIPNSRRPASTDPQSPR